MTIEVRQLLIRSTVDSPVRPCADAGRTEAEGRVPDEEWERQFRRALLDECKRWVDRRLAEQAER